MTKSQIDRWLIIAILLLAWGLRLICLDTVPTGWRDDELINIHALSGELLEGRFPLYFTGASGHEPLYHYLLAGAHAVWGFNPLSGHLLSIALGTLTVALTYVLARHMFGRTVAVVASLVLATSFWSLMYSRIALRHINLPPLALVTFYLLWRLMAGKSQISNLKSQLGRIILLGFAVGISFYVYPAARLLPVLMVLFGGYLALFHRDRFKRHWRGLLLALVVASLVSVPLGVAIAQGRGEAAEQSEGIGADSRITELAVPLRELLAGDPRPLLENVWATLGMFHATGDPEWLYNIAGRPVFNLLGGALFWAGVALCVFRWRRPCYFFLLLWLGGGLVPTFLSIPSASLSHSILVMPVVYILLVLPLVEGYRWLESLISNLKSPVRLPLFAICHLLFAIFLASSIVRDLRDYFVVWPRQELVRVLYRADYRDAARYLDAQPEIADVAISSTLLGPWDRLALEVDIRRDDVGVRLFDPGRALVWSGEDTTSTVLLAPWPPAASPIDELLEAHTESMAISSHLTLYTLSPISNLQSPISNVTRFANGLELVEARWIGEADLLTIWRVTEPLDLPPMPIVANPPPPGVYSGPRLKVFAHLLAADGTQVADDDGLWVDPLTLRPGDTFVQVHRFAVSGDGPYSVRLGLYDPKPGEEMRWDVLDDAGQPVADHVVVPGGE
ncbi:MAG: glycosyltransferase family 39 protein [Anaerolineae bacterium]|nr:glycosyltransferase family 39 protein [Anaerolineae bacterium]